MPYQKCHEEVDKLIPRGMTIFNIEYEDIANLPYLNSVIKEALRLHPPAQFLARYW